MDAIVIDPQLTLAAPSPQPTSQPSPAQNDATNDGASATANPPGTPDMPDENSESESIQKPRKGKRQRTRHQHTVGSEADFKRKEANRLAAERSRSRAAEKTKAVNKAYAALIVENDELLAAIGQIELATDMAQAEQERKLREEREERHQREVEAQVEAAIAVAQQEMENVPVGERDERNILAALISGGMGMEGFEGVGGDEWAQGVESLMKEVETTGRLGELAAVATVPAEAETQPEGAAGEGLIQEATAAEKETNDGNIDPALTGFATEEILEAKDNVIPEPKALTFSYNAIEAATATINAVAIVLNAEIEKTVRDEVALTRAAIARIEKEIAKAGDGVDMDANGSSAMLPVGILSEDEEELGRAVAAGEEVRAALAAGMDALTAKVIAAREAKDVEEAQVARGVEELLKIAATEDDDEKGKIMVILKSIRGYIGNHIWGLRTEANPDDTLLGIAFSTPAIARRRRGRPPKNSFPLRYNHASIIYPSLPLDSPISTATIAGQNISPTYPATAPVSRKRRARGLAPSKLSINDTGDDEDFLVTHINEAGEEVTVPRPPLLAPNGQPLDPAFQSHEWTESVLSRLKKGGPGSCDICARTETSVWRKMVLGGEDYRVCNACGLYHRKFGVIRPPSLWGDGEVKKRRAAVGPEDGRRNRKVKKMLYAADQANEAAEAAAAAAAAAVAEAEEAQVQAEADVVAAATAAVAEAQAGMGTEGGMEDHEEMLRMAGAHDEAGGQGQGDGEGGNGVHGEVHHMDLDGHMDVDVNGFEVIEEELRVLHGDGIFAGME